MARLSSGQSLMRIAALLTAGVVVTIGLAIWDLQGVLLADARQQAARLGTAVAEQTSRSVQAADVTLQDLRRFVQDHGLGADGQLAGDFREHEVSDQLKVQADVLPQVEAFSIVDAHGSLVASSRTWPLSGVNLADRDYFQYFRDHQDDELLVTAVVANRVDGKHTAYLVRRVNGPRGEFLGLVLAALDLGYFQDFYRALSGASDVAFTLRRLDGRLLAQYPPRYLPGSPVSDDAHWADVVAAGGGGSYDLPMAASRNASLVTLTRVPGYPLVIDVSVARWLALSGWRREMALAGLGTACAVLCFALLLRAMLRQIRFLSDSETSLVNQNTRLEVAHQRLEVQGGELARTAGELRLSEARLAQKTMALQTTLDHMGQGLITVEADRTVSVYNRRACEMLDLPVELLATHPSFDQLVAYQVSIGEFSDPANTAPDGAGNAVVLTEARTHERRRPNGRIVEIQSIPLTGGGMVRTYTDITSRRDTEERVKYFAHYDNLTKLANRVVFNEQLQRAMEMAAVTGRSVALLYLDLDRFKQVNDTRGHAMGDRLLAEVGSRIRSAVRDIDTVARMGGDEFAIIQPLVEQPDAALALAERVADLIGQPYELDGRCSSVGVSIGIALYPNHAANSTEVQSKADMALYRAKRSGRGVSLLFDAAVDVPQREGFVVEQELRDALGGGEFELEFQPIAKSGTREVVSFEALLRWRHPTQGLLRPAQFMEIAESSGLIVPIGKWALMSACREATRWPEHIRLSVNLSPLQFRNGNLVKEVSEALAESGLHPSRLSLEVTEGVLLDRTESVLVTMRTLRSTGVRFSLDDFGTAHAGLSYLRCFPFDTLKIDRSFVQDPDNHRETRAIVEAILAIGTALNIEVIAEGVETEGQLRLLKQMQCQLVQGFLIGLPARAADTRNLVWEGPWRRAAVTGVA